MRKGARLEIRLSDAELETVKQAAARAGAPVSRWVRNTLLEAALGVNEERQLQPVLATVAQPVERGPETPKVAGSTPARGTCSNAPFHRKGAYCKRCGKVA